MKKYFFFFSVFFFHSYIAKAIVLKKTKMFIEIEVNKKDIWVACNDIVESNNSYLGFSALENGKIYFFYYRRPYTIKQCRELENEYWSIVNQEGKVKIVGTSPDYNDSPSKKGKRIPQRFSLDPNATWAVFTRLQSKSKCKAYFDDDCELPKNYWGGVISE